MRLANSQEPMTNGMVAAIAPAQISGPTWTGPGTYLGTASSAKALWQRHTAAQQGPFRRHALFKGPEVAE